MIKIQKLQKDCRGAIHRALNDLQNGREARIELRPYKVGGRQ
jgi:hypothetical protein